MKKMFRTMLSVLVLVLLMGVTCLADEGLKVMQVQNPDGQPSVFVKGIGAEVESADAMIGNVACSNVTPAPIKGEDVSMRTLFLVDNSISIPERSREAMKSLITEVIAGREGTEQFAVATFGEEMIMVADFSNDYSALKAAVDGIEFADQETYLTDVLYGLIAEDKFNEDPDRVYRRIVILSDGVDSKDIGITTEELNAQLAASGLPIYSVGIYNSRKTNADGIEKMFSISRQTNAETFLLDEIENELDVVNTLAEDRNIVRFDVFPEAEVKDGSKKAMTLNIHTAGGDLAVNVDDVRMAQEAQIEEEVVEEPAETTEEESIVFKPDKDEKEEEAKDDSDDSMIIFVVVVVVIVTLLLLAAIIFLVINMMKKKKEADEFRVIDSIDELIDFPHGNGGKQSGNGSGNVPPVVGQRDPFGEERTERTVIIIDENRNYNVTLTDVASPARSFSRRIDDRLVIGRSRTRTDICIDYDNSVSGEHCAIELRSGKFYLIDLQSSNGTYVEGNRVLSDIEIDSGSVITLGNIHLRVEIS